MSDASSSTGELPAGPTGVALAHTWAWMRRPIELMDECAAKFGRRFTLRFVGNRSYVFLHHPEDIKASFAANPEALPSGRANQSFVPFFGRYNLFSLDGEDHRRHRRLIMPPLRGETLVAYLPLIEQITREAIATWPTGEAFSIYEEMRLLTFTIIAQAIFGVREAPRIEAVRGYMHRIMNGLGAGTTYLKFLQRDLGPWSPWGRFLRDRRRLFAVLQEEIDAVRDAGVVRDDVLARLIAESRARNDPMSDAELHSELFALLGAGHETSATGLAWVFQNLLSNPEALARARDEARGNPSALHPDELPFVSAVVSESLRLMPPVPIAVRYVAKPLDLAGWSPPVGTYLALCAYLAHRSPAAFDEPASFRPERFVGARPPPWVYFPYGGGPRLCVGASFAHFEMVSIAATVLRALDLTLEGPAFARPVRAKITIIPSGGVPVRIGARR